jgi:hypothetical protein
MGKHGEELHSIAVILYYDIRAGIAPTGDMVDGPEILNAERTGQGWKYSGPIVRL